MIKEILINQWATSILTSIISFITSVLIARELGPEQFGKYALIIAVGTILSIIIEGGFKNIILNNEITQNTERENYLIIAIRHIFISSIIIIVIISFISIITNNTITYILCTIYFGAITLLQLISTILKGRGLHNKDSKIQIYTKLYILIVTLLVLSAYKDIDYLLLSFSAVLLYVIYLNKKYIKISNSTTKISRAYKNAIPFFCIEICITIYIRSGIIIMGITGIDDISIGNYTASFKIIEGLIMLSFPIGFIVRNKILTSQKFMVDNFIKYLKLSLIFGILIAIANIFIGDEIIALLYGDQYHSSSHLIKYFFLFILLIFSNSILNQYLIGLNIINKSLSIYFYSTIINIVLNLTLINSYGVLGLIIASSLTEMLIFISMLTLILKRLKKINE